jgi:predicted acyl esterase
MAAASPQGRRLRGLQRHLQQNARAGPSTAAADSVAAGIDIPAAQNAIRLEQSVMVPMRDGVRLSTDLYFPMIDGAGTAALPLGVCLMRTPYDKNGERSAVEEPAAARPNEVAVFASQGFVVAVQDSRGKHESEGLYIDTLSREGEDGYDTVGWMAEQAWCNGNVGTFGCSYPCEVQYLQAPLRHPNLKCMIPQNGPALGAANGRYRYALASRSEPREGPTHCSFTATQRNSS